MIESWNGDLLEEKSLWQVYKASTKLKKSSFNQIIYLLFGVSIAMVAIGWLLNQDVENSFKAAMLAADLSFNLSVQILGFLIGGFAIFATVTDHRLMIALAKTPMDNGPSVFKNVFYNFLSVFGIFIVTLSISVIVKIIGVIAGFDLINYLFHDDEKLVKCLINSAGFFVLCSLLCFSIVRLKSFIWNIYTTFIVFLRTAEILHQIDKDSAS